MEETSAQPKSNQRVLVLVLIAFFAGLAAVILILFRFTQSSSQLQSADFIEGLEKEQVTIGLREGSLILYPNNTYDTESLSFNNAVFEGLTQIKNGRVVPGLAKSWTNPDELTWRITLQEGVEFQSGHQMKASDVKFSIDQAKNNADWPTNFIATRIDSVTVIDDSTVELKTVAADPTLLHWMVFLFILSEEQVNEEGLENAVGTGAYEIVSLEETEASLTANNNYWGAAPKVRTLIYKTYADDQALADALDQGEINIAAIYKQVPVGNLSQKGFRVIESRQSDVNFLGFDLLNDKSPGVDKETNPFKNSSVRRAILLALNIPQLVTDADLDAEALSQFGVPELVGFNTTLERPQLDRQTAKDLLSEAGFEGGFAVTLDVLATQSSVAEAIKEQLAEIGIIVTANLMEFDPFLEKVGSGASSFYLLTYLPDTLDSTDLLNSFMHSFDDSGKGSVNFSSYSNAEVDQLLDQASSSFELAERADLVSQAQEKIMEEIPYLPLYTRLAFFVMTEDVAFEPAPFGYFFATDLSGRQRVADE